MEAARIDTEAVLNTPEKMLNTVVEVLNTFWSIRKTKRGYYVATRRDGRKVLNIHLGKSLDRATEKIAAWIGKHGGGAEQPNETARAAPQTVPDAVEPVETTPEPERETRETAPIFSEDCRECESYRLGWCTAVEGKDFYNVLLLKSCPKGGHGLTMPESCEDCSRFDQSHGMRWCWRPEKRAYKNMATMMTCPQTGTALCRPRQRPSAHVEIPF